MERRAIHSLHSFHCVSLRENRRRRRLREGSCARSRFLASKRSFWRKVVRCLPAVSWTREARTRNWARTILADPFTFLRKFLLGERNLESASQRINSRRSRRNKTTRFLDDDRKCDLQLARHFQLMTLTSSCPPTTTTTASHRNKQHLSDPGLRCKLQNLSSMHLSIRSFMFSFATNAETRDFQAQELMLFWNRATSELMGTCNLHCNHLLDD